MFSIKNLIKKYKKQSLKLAYAYNDSGKHTDHEDHIDHDTRLGHVDHDDHTDWTD